MKRFTGSVISKLPGTGTSIFAVMSKLAEEHNAINLSQGFPDFPISEKLISLVNKYMKLGYNQYAPMPGIPDLRQQIAARVERTYGVTYDPDKEINITAGATQAIFTAITAFIRDEDEVVVFEPAYDSYVPSVKLQGGMVKYAELKYPDYSVDWEQLPRLISPRTKMIIINSPHNPTGSLIKAEDLKKMEQLIKNTDIIVLSDEVYEHLIFDKHEHQSVCRFPGLASRSIIVGSFGKTFHTTGWKMGYALAPENLMKEFRKTHQFVVFACNTPVQYAMAEFLKYKSNYEGLPRFYQQKRDYFLELIRDSRFKPIPSKGTYFQLLDYSDISDEKETDFSIRLVTENKIASIPVSVFYHKKKDHKVLRFCFAKTDETLEKAAEILCRI